MKKLLFISLMAILFASCTGEDGRDGRDGKDGVADWSIINVTILDGDWQLMGKVDEIGSYYYADVEINDLTDFVYKSGTVLSYLVYDDSGVAVKSGLPFVNLHGDIIDDGNGNPIEKYWTETFTSDYLPGSMRFKVTLSDFYTNYRPGDKKFTVVLMW